MKSRKLHTLVECSILIALATVLSLIKIINLPFGGSVTLLSMLPIIYIGFAHGSRWGFGSAFIFSLFQVFTSEVFAWGLSPTVLIVCIVADYLVAFTVLGMTGFFRKKGTGGVIVGTSVALFCRFLCHFISGVTIWRETAEWANYWLWSIAYNGTFMLPELIFTVTGAVIIFHVPYLKKKLSD